MFEQVKANEARAKESAVSLDQPVQEFLQVWQAMKAELKDKMRLKRLELKVDGLWDRLEQVQKDATWMICFPEHRTVKEVFEAHAVNLRGAA
jgi:hypothetical protein